MDEEYIRTKIERVRYLFSFETLSSYSAISEITFANEGNEYINIIKYDLGEYKPFLKISDSNGEFLEFAKAREAELENCSDYLINIYLPQGRELKPQCRRTITFQNFSPSSNNREKSEYENPTYVMFLFEMVDQVNSYIIIEAAENFDFHDYVDVVDQNGVVIDERELGDFFKERTVIANKIGRRIYLSFKGDASKRTLRITHQHDAPKRLLNWIRVGLGLGGLSAFFLPVSLFYSLNSGLLDSPSLLITYPVFVITTLIVIKGWLFLKDLDNELERYNNAYIFLVIILILELIAIFIVSFLGNDACLWFKDCSNAVNSLVMAMQQI
ncbi:MAG: hypothetical protein LLF90_07015 [Methanomicrobiaceae archaeon]|uniref:hypothetical protein n=2 Tax=cellular organisms TaxID=131567 RepID=UPI00321078B6|nr:hypothetical protein [Methanomicrobiaceae archaeon]